MLGMFLVGVGLWQLLGNAAWIWIGFGVGIFAEGLFGIGTGRYKPRD
ncbi:MAG TPA: hypothetical protein VND22_06260 [Actinomycetota bacterium]|nr:hypothetical protein [Actinomycetota bacterium]